MTVFADDAPADEGGQLGDGTTLRVRMGKLEDRGTLARGGVLPNLADLDRCEVRWTACVGMRHPADAGNAESGGQDPSPLSTRNRVPLESIRRLSQAVARFRAIRQELGGPGSRVLRPNFCPNFCPPGMI